MFVRSALPCTSISTLTDWIVPVGVATCCPAAASVAAVKVYVAVPSAFVVGVTLLQPSGNRPVVVTTTKRGEPPWHWAVLASVNDPDWNA